ncbi:hypothetical protein NMY22_g6639 [Coprinellus aureogranulatus]|nr:hypothetical protein NMY22_g6639 [Coprinellus aureogranulatus]
MARTKISPPALPRSSKASYRPAILNRGRSASPVRGQQTTKAVVRGYWANLAHTLGGSLNDEYSSAVETLASLFALPLSEFIAVSSKITALIELVHNALHTAGVQTYEFSYCAPALVPHKLAYFRLLRLLRDRRNDIPDHLQDRVQRLLLPLSPSFQVHTGAGPSHGVGTCSQSPRGSPKTPTLEHAPSPVDTRTYILSRVESQRPRMPPPPVNWRDARTQATSRNPSALRRGTQLWTHDEALRALAHLNKRTHNGDADPRPVKRRRTSSTSTPKGGYRVVALPPEGDQENTTPDTPKPAADDLPRVIRPPPRRFGIFLHG